MPDEKPKHENAVVQDISDLLTEEYAKMVNGPMQRDINRWLKRIGQAAKKSMSEAIDPREAQRRMVEDWGGRIPGFAASFDESGGQRRGDDNG